MTFCRSAASYQCEREYTCLTQAERDRLGLPPTRPECERAFESSCESGLARCIDDSHDYATTAGATCLDQMSRAACNDAGELFLDAPACTQVCERTAGAFRIAWRFQPFHVCSELGIEHFSLISTAANGMQYVDTFRCDDWNGVTDPLPTGSYQLRVELASPTGERLWSTAVGAHTVDAPVVELDELVIPVSS